MSADPVTAAAQPTGETTTAKLSVDEIGAMHDAANEAHQDAGGSLYYRWSDPTEVWQRGIGRAHAVDFARRVEAAVTARLASSQEAGERDRQIVSALKLSGVQRELRFAIRELDAAPKGGMRVGMPKVTITVDAGHARQLLALISGAPTPTDGDANG